MSYEPHRAFWTCYFTKCNATRRGSVDHVTQSRGKFEYALHRTTSIPSTIAAVPRIRSRSHSTFHYLPSHLSYGFSSSAARRKSTLWSLLFFVANQCPAHKTSPTTAVASTTGSLLWPWKYSQAVCSVHYTSLRLSRVLTDVVWFEYQLAILHRLRPTSYETPRLCHIHCSGSPAMSEGPVSNGSRLLGSPSLHLCLHDRFESDMWRHLLEHVLGYSRARGKSDGASGVLILGLGVERRAVSIATSNARLVVRVCQNAPVISATPNLLDLSSIRVSTVHTLSHIGRCSPS